MTRVGFALMSGLLVLAPALVVATHGSAGRPAVVESERLVAGANGSTAGKCHVAGVVQNPSLSETVTVRLEWRGLDAKGSPVAIALARIPWLRPGERRPFTSSPFVATTSGQVLSSCEGIPHLERLEAVAEPIPAP
jgi:hypothetical protein